MKSRKGSPPNQHVSVTFSADHRETIAKALGKLRGQGQQSPMQTWPFGNSSESAFIRDVTLFAAEQILEGKSRDKALLEQIVEMGRLAFSLEWECGKLRRSLIALKPKGARPAKPHLGKRGAA